MNFKSFQDFRTISFQSLINNLYLQKIKLKPNVEAGPFRSNMQEQEAVGTNTGTV